MKATKILIVEDEAIVAESLSLQLEELGYVVTGIAASGAEAIERVVQPPPDLVLMDIMLKGDVDGITVAGQIQERFDIPVIYLTAYSDPGTLQRAKITQPFGYIVKPVKERDLHTNIEIALYKHKTEKKIRENEQWLTTVLRSIGDAVITTDTHQRISYISPIAETMTGWTLDQVQNQDVSKFFQIKHFHSKGGNDDTMMRDLMAKAVAGETTACLVSRDLVVVSKDGEAIPIDAGIAPIRNERKRVTGVVMTLRDVRERKRAEEALTEAQQMLANMLTPREKEILELIVDGSSTKEIAFDLNISPRTVEVHRQNIMQKFNVHDMPMLIRFTLTHRLVTLHDSTSN